MIINEKQIHSLIYYISITASSPEHACHRDDTKQDMLQLLNEINNQQSDKLFDTRSKSFAEYWQESHDNNE